MEMIDPFVFRLSIFVLAIFVGYFVVWGVTLAVAHSTDVSDQRHFFSDCRRRADCGGGAGDGQRLLDLQGAGLFCSHSRQCEHLWRLPRYRPYARNV